MPSRQGPGDHQQAAETAQGKGVPWLQLYRCLQGLPCFCAVFLPEGGQSQRHLRIGLGVGITGIGQHRPAQ